ncbi:hypothetical protein R1flu_005904 [Riccia fluitans]|uniref:TANGO6 HEAT repeat domain-containing protein n=1 Tax=Riccia fluitans TaxID=41844 RepID=A0ABD1YUR1_9MARC
MMPSREGKSTRSAKAVLKEARSVLSSIADQRQQDSLRATTAADTNSSLPSHQFLLHSVELVEECHRLLKSGTSFEFKDWTVLKAVVELVVRWGIYPYLSPGVGIPLQKRFGQRAASAAAKAVSDYLRASESLVTEHEAKREVESSINNPQAHPLVFSADLLSYLLLERIFLPPSEITQEDRVKIIDDNQEKEGDQNAKAEDDDEQKYQGKYTPAVVSSPAALRQHILTHHLIDVIASLLQIAHDGRQLDTKFWREEAEERIKAIVARLPVDYVVEALFNLLGEGNSGSQAPSWLKPGVGKLLSRIVASRSGALATVMERLSGGAESGSVHVYERVAAHLAKVPRHVCTKDDYYKIVCRELQLLLFLPEISYLHSSTSKAYKNMHHTSIIMACLLAHQEPSLTEKYLLRPIVDRLLSWNNAEVEGNTNRLEESSLLDSLHVLRLLLTAGHEKALSLRELLLPLTSPLVPKLILLEYLLWPAWHKHNARRLDSTEKRGEKGGQMKGGLKVGFLEGKRLYNSEEEEEDEGKVKGTVPHVMGCISDNVAFHLKQPVLHSVPIVVSFLFELSASSLSWPSNEGQIAGAIEVGKGQGEFPAMYISKRLLTGEYWELTLALMDKLLRRVLLVRKAALMKNRESPFQNRDQLMEQAVKLLETFEVLYVEVGFKAVEKDATKALPLLKVLLDDSDLSSDGEMVELVLRLLQTAASQLHEELKFVEDEKHILYQGRAEQIELLNGLGVSLDRIIASSQVGKESKEYAGMVKSAVSHLVSSITTRT